MTDTALFRMDPGFLQSFPEAAGDVAGRETVVDVKTFPTGRGGGSSTPKGQWNDVAGRFGELIKTFLAGAITVPFRIAVALGYLVLQFLVLAGAALLLLAALAFGLLAFCGLIALFASLLEGMGLL